MNSNFDKFPSVEVSKSSRDCTVGWREIGEVINNHISAIGKEKVIVVVDCYQGVSHVEVERALKEHVRHDEFYNATDYFKSEKEVKEMVYPNVTDDLLFGYLTSLDIGDFFDQSKSAEFKEKLNKINQGIIIVYGEGAAHLVQGDVLLYLDMARWEIQMRMRKCEVNNLGVKNKDVAISLKYKQSYFVDWRLLDRHKARLINQWDYLIDTHKAGQPKMISGASVLKGLARAAQQPFRVVPFFDPGPWGGQWLKEVAGLDKSVVNYAWAFDCVPEENSLLLSFGDTTVEMPSINLVFNQPDNLLGEKVYKKFGAEFPIRFDLLDTMEGGNLSLQVHPTKEYVKEQFGMPYTQEESYYMLDAKEDAIVYLGLKDGFEPETMINELREAQKGESAFDADKFVMKWPARKHDHFLIPPGTVHCSGKDSVTLEISATPNLFTFKLWDWGRLGLDGKPRPINIDHGKEVIQWDQRETWVEENLVNDITKVAEGDGWIEEKTGLHKSQFIETRRHWFSKKVLHDTQGNLNVLNLVEGREAIVESPSGKFEPFIVHYAETFIIPAAVGEYTIRPYGKSEGEQCATLKAFVR